MGNANERGDASPITHHPSRSLVHYYVAEKNPHLGQAIAGGFKAKLANAFEKKLKRNALHLIGGLQHGSLELMQQVIAAGEPYIFFDRAYFGGGPGTDCLRVVPAAYQKHWLERWPDDRLRAIRSKAEGGRRKAEGFTPPTSHLPPPAPAEIRPWRMQGAHVLIVPPGEAICRLFGLGDWLGRTEKMVRDAFDGPVIVSRKGEARPARDHFDNCWAVVTYTSNVAVEATCAGVPCFVDRKSAAAPVAMLLEQFPEHCERPYLADNREAWAASLAYGQFTFDEIASGFAAEVVMAHFRD